MEPVKLDLRGTDLETMKMYLGVLGGVEQPDGRFAGDGWVVHLEPSVHRFRQWEFPRVILTFEGEPDQVREITRRTLVIASRGGG